MADDKGAAGRRVILRHAAKFATWQSLQKEGVDDQQKVGLILQWSSADVGYRLNP